MIVTTIQYLSEQPTGDPDGVDLLPDFVLGEMLRRGPGIVEPVHVESVRAPATRWVFHPADTGAVETVAETRRSCFRAILARFGWFAGINPYGGQAELSVSASPFDRSATHHFSFVLCNSHQTGFTICIRLHPHLTAVTRTA